MRPWHWIINDLYKEVVAKSLDKGADLFNALDHLEQTEEGYPQEGEHTREDSVGDVVRWRVAGYEILYERIVEGNFLLMAAIEESQLDP